MLLKSTFQSGIAASRASLVLLAAAVHLVSSAVCAVDDQLVMSVHGP